MISPVAGMWGARASLALLSTLVLSSRAKAGGTCVDLAARIAAVNAECCGEKTEDCSSGKPATCNLDCARILLPFFEDCQEEIALLGLGGFDDVAALCHATEAVGGPPGARATPRLFPTPQSLQLSQPAEAVALDPCFIAMARYGGGIDSVDAARWPDQRPETSIAAALEIYRPLILRAAECDATATPYSSGALLVNIAPAGSNWETERYSISIGRAPSPPPGTGRVLVQGLLVTSSYVGLLRGLETLSQLVTVAADGGLWIPPSVAIQDAPTFAHRGILLDTARNFMPVQALRQTIDALMYSKMNVPSPLQLTGLILSISIVIPQNS